MNLKWILILALGMGARMAWAFPEMVAHGYMNCNACHTQVTGGNLLTEYGRSISRELLSQTSLFGHPVQEGDEKFLYGFVPTPAWLTLGGDERILQSFLESKKVSQGHFMIMQIDVDASAQIGTRWRAFASLDRIVPNSADATAKDYVSSPRYGFEYLLSKPDAEDRVALRLGRFMPAYGIAFAEHTFATRQYLDFGPGQERQALEASWNNDRTSVIATAIFSRMADNTPHVEKGGTVQVATAVGDKSKVGANYYQSQVDDGTNRFARRMYGAFAHIGLGKDWYALIEADRAERADQKWGTIETSKLGYQIFQGLQAFAVHEFANFDTTHANPRMEAYSAGLDWFPRPHWELYGLYRKDRNTAVTNDFQDEVWLIGHFYL